MTQLPGALFIIDPKREHLAVHEASRLGILTIAMVDSNTDPGPIDIVLPANDDAIRSIRLITAGIAQAAINGRLERESTTGEETDFADAVASTDDLFAAGGEPGDTASDSQDVVTESRDMGLAPGA
jgi:small subunit ribosomal protein S2